MIELKRGTGITELLEKDLIEELRGMFGRAIDSRLMYEIDTIVNKVLFDRSRTRGAYLAGDLKELRLYDGILLDTELIRGRLKVVRRFDAEKDYPSVLRLGFEFKMEEEQT